MANAFDKIYLAIAGVMMAVTAPVNADDCMTSSCCETTCDPSCPSPCCPFPCKQGPYCCGPNCIPAPYCQEFNLKGEVLYWTASLGGLEAVFGNTLITSVTNPATSVITTTIIESDVNPDFQWTPGFRIGADYAFTCFDFEADWTHFNGRAKFSGNSQSGRWKIRYDAVDLMFGRRCCVAPCFYFKPFIGVRGANIHQTLTAHTRAVFTTALLLSSTVLTDKNDKETFWGIGPELGVEAYWYLGCNWSLYGSFDVVTYYGTVKGRVLDTDTFPIPQPISVVDGTIRHRFNCIGTDGAIGIRWDKAWPIASEGLLSLKAGLEQHRIYDFSNLGSDGTLSMDGAVFGISGGYRY